MFSTSWSDQALKDKKSWKEMNNPKILGRINQLEENLKETPYTGIGKPEPLKHGLVGAWSRRIDQRHRLIYLVDEKNKTIEIKSCKGHYKK